MIVDIKRNGSQPSGQGPADWFIGPVRIDTPFQGTAPARVGGAIVWFAPGERHWHGAAATTAMTHVAIAERLDGGAVTWMEEVCDAQYMDERRATETRLRARSQPKRANVAPRSY